MNPRIVVSVFGDAAIKPVIASEPTRLTSAATHQKASVVVRLADLEDNTDIDARRGCGSLAAEGILPPPCRIHSAPHTASKTIHIHRWTM